MSKYIKEEWNNHIKNQAPSKDLWNKIENSLPEQLEEKAAKAELEKISESRQQAGSGRNGNNNAIFLRYAGMVAAACFCGVVVFAVSQIKLGTKNSDIMMNDFAPQSTEEEGIYKKSDSAEGAVAPMEESTNMAEDVLDEEEMKGESADRNNENKVASEKQTSELNNAEVEKGMADTSEVIVYEKVRIKVMERTIIDELAQYSVQIIEAGVDSPFKKEEQIRIITDTYSGNALILNTIYTVDLSQTDDEEVYRLQLVH